MPQFVKLKGVVKVRSHSDYDLREAVNKLLERNGYNFYSHGYYRVSLAFKVGKRWKLKSYRMEVYNKYPCECCGPYYVAEFV